LLRTGPHHQTKNENLRELSSPDRWRSRTAVGAGPDAL